MATGDDLDVVVRLLHRALGEHAQTRAVIESNTERWMRDKAAILAEIENLKRARAAVEDRHLGIYLALASVIVLIVVDIAVHLGSGS